MKFPHLTHENFLMYAIKAYNNPLCTGADEFKKDMKHFVYILKFLNKLDPVPQECAKFRLMINHVIILRNLFGNIPTARMLFFYYPEKHHRVIAAVLEYLQFLPAPHQVPETDLYKNPPCIHTSEILGRM